VENHSGLVETTFEPAKNKLKVIIFWGVVLQPIRGPKVWHNVFLRCKVVA
jgi:hypothetical protein